MDLGPLAALSLGGGVLGAVIKIVVGLIMLSFRQKSEDREHVRYLVDKQKEFKELGPDPHNAYVSHTRRILAWGMCFTFCSICLLWSIFPGAEVIKSGGGRGSTINLFLFHWTVNRDLGYTVTTDSIVWELIPFMSMVLMTYFTPDISKYR